MKNTVIALGAFLASSLLMAGGNVSPSLPHVASVPAGAHTEQSVYTNYDTDLMWQDEAYTDAEEGAYKNGKSLGKAGNHAHATKYCARLHYAGHNDWRLPTADDLTAVHHPEGEPFKYYKGSDFWSSTPTTQGRYYVVFPADAYRFARNKRQSNYIRCVRKK